MSSTTEHAKSGDPVRRIMAERIAAVETGESLLSVAQELLAGDIGAVLVSSPGTPAGMVSERDIVTMVTTGDDLATVQAGEVMTGDLVKSSGSIHGA